MEYTTVKAVPLLRTGTWNGSTGGTTPITKTDLANIAEAARDGDLDPAIIKIGHADGRFPTHTDDGEPAYGTVTNVRLSHDGETLLADFKQVPADLASKMPSAYPNRSVELRSGVSLKDAAGKVVKEFKRVLTAVALLGATPPAVKGLNNVHAAFSHGDELEAGDPETIMLRLGHPLTVEQTREALATAIGNAATVVDFTDRLVWYRQATPGPQGATVKHYQRSYTETDGRIELTGDPVEAEPQTSTAFVPTTGDDTGNVPPLADVEPHSEPDTPTEERKSAVATLADLFEALGATTPESADYTTIELPDEAVELLAKAFEDKGEAVAETENTEAPEAPPAADLSEAPTGTVQLSEAQFTELTEQNTSMRAQLDQLTKAADDQRRDQIIETALSEGRLHPTERDAWRKALEDSETVTTTLLSQRTPIAGMIEIGSATATTATTLAEAREAAIDSEEARIFGEEA